MSFSSGGKVLEICDFIEGSGTKYLDEWFVVDHHNQVLTPHGEKSGLLQTPSDSQSLPFDWCKI
jgi:hypothetical protein